MGRCRHRRWSRHQFSAARADAYVRALIEVMRHLGEGPALPGIRRHPDLPDGILMLRAPPRRSRGQHALLLRCRESSELRQVEVLRVLHLRMDLARHLPPG